jgi:hypothetical protein
VPDESAPSKLTTAWIGLVAALLGAVVGSLVAGGFAYAIDQHRRHDEERRRTEDKLAAIRLITLEIKQNDMTLRIMVLDGRGRHMPPLRETVWMNAQGTLARYLPVEAWHRVAEYYSRIESFRALLSTQRCIRLGFRGGLKQTVNYGQAKVLRSLGIIEFREQWGPGTPCSRS